MLLKDAMQQFPHARKAIEHMDQGLAFHIDPNQQIRRSSIITLDNVIKTLGAETLGEFFGDDFMPPQFPRKHVDVIAWQEFVNWIVSPMIQCRLIGEFGKSGIVADRCLAEIAGSI